MSAIELKPCPFCGAEPESGAWDEYGLAIQCSSNLSKCPINPACSGYDHQATIERWNTRAPQWQPIETAPKDGTHLLLFGDGDMVVAYFNVGYGTWDDGDHHDDIQGLTHWQQLPAAPEVSR